MSGIEFDTMAYWDDNLSPRSRGALKIKRNFFYSAWQTLITKQPLELIYISRQCAKYPHVLPVGIRVARGIEDQLSPRDGDLSGQSYRWEDVNIDLVSERYCTVTILLKGHKDRG